MCEALISSRLLHALEAIPIPELLYDRRNSSYFKGLREMLGMATLASEAATGVPAVPPALAAEAATGVPAVPPALASEAATGVPAVPPALASEAATGVPAVPSALATGVPAAARKNGGNVTLTETCAAAAACNW